MTQNNKEMKELCDGITRNPKCPFHGGKVIIKPQTPKRMTLSEVIKRNEEKVDEIFSQDKTGERVEYWLAMKTGKLIPGDKREFCKIATPDDIKSFLRSSQESIVEFVREWAEKKWKIYKNKLHKSGAIGPEIEDKEYVDGYNQALSDLLQELNTNK